MTNELGKQRLTELLVRKSDRSLVRSYQRNLADAEEFPEVTEEYLDVFRDEIRKRGLNEDDDWHDLRGWTEKQIIDADYMTKGNLYLG